MLKKLFFAVLCGIERNDTRRANDKAAIRAWRSGFNERCRFLGRRMLAGELRDGFPGVREALRREIAGLVLLGRLCYGDLYEGLA
ncbi:hypothetical protein, partial [Ruegeria jejuensis]|uniref:hypothetical protein n=1 Tax=Ruegeria jejuensis TaxID=3233338 RepID=UPI00355BF8B9